eukprot:807926-Pelagomonas_calceolata.AAC.1
MSDVVSALEQGLCTSAGAHTLGRCPCSVSAKDLARPGCACGPLLRGLCCVTDRPRSSPANVLRFTHALSFAGENTGHTQIVQLFYNPCISVCI